MKITDIKFGMLRVPLKTPFKTALRTVENVEDIIVAIHTDTGHVGYGEAPATAVITGDTHGSIIEAIRKFIAPRLIGQDIANLNRIVQLIQTALEKNSSAKAAVEIAVYDLFGQLYGAPLYKLLGGGDPVVTTDITISVDYIDKMVADSLAAVERGFESLKIKVGKDIGVDLERIKAIHAAVEDRALLRLDANQGWTAKQAVHAIQTLEDAGIRLELVEQPVKAQDLEGLKYVTERVHTPIMADESVFGPTEVSDRTDSHACGRYHQHQAHEDRRYLQRDSHRRYRRHASRRMHDRLHARDEHQRCRCRSRRRRQVERHHESRPRRPFALRLQPGRGRRGVQ
jgi:L-alanine-DL-glutamate epimerase-like enolase superfamily enzyme